MNIESREGFLTYAVGFLLVMLLGTILLATILDVQPMTTMNWSLRDVAIGIGAAIGMMLGFGFIAPVRKQAEDVLGPMLAMCRWSDFIVLAIFVGIIEELLFRGVMEQSLARVNPIFALVVVNIIFGLLHAVSLAYAVLAGLLGAILSLLAHGPGEYNLLRPIVAHAVYDYIGFIWITYTFRRSHPNFPAEEDDETDPQEERPADGD